MEKYKKITRVKNIDSDKPSDILIEILGELYILDDDVEVGSVVLMPNNDINIINNDNILDYLDSNSYSTKRIVGTTNRVDIIINNNIPNIDLKIIDNIIEEITNSYFEKENGYDIKTTFNHNASNRFMDIQKIVSYTIEEIFSSINIEIDNKGKNVIIDGYLNLIKNNE